MGKTYGISIHSLQIMRISSILIFLQLFAVYLFAAHDTNAQLISIATDRASVREVFSQIEKQAKFTFSYQESTIKETPTITLYIKNKQLTEVLFELSKKTDLNFKQIGKVIAVTKIKKDGPQKENGLHLKPIKAVQDYEMISTQDTIRGKVINESREPLIGASVAVKGTKTVAITGNDGGFVLPNTEKNATLIITYVGYESREVNANNTANVILDKKNSYLDEVQVIPYGTTTRRLNTGSISNVSAKEIEQQPVANPLGALVGRVPGLVVIQQSGVPGSSFTVQIRGRNSIRQGSQPLILIDGIPFAAGNENIGLISSAITNSNQNSGVSPLNGISPLDIESIEVLKDADATAIYGSRGANGVILITTKKGKAGKSRITANFNQGHTRVGQKLTLLNTDQYIEMRQEAFENAGTVPNTTNAPDLTLWDNSRYTDFQKEFIGGTGKLTNANLSLSGGSEGTQYMFSSNYNRETSVYPTLYPNQRGGFLTNITHRSVDDRFNVAFSGNLTSVENRSPKTDFTTYTFISPNTPSFFDTDGSLKWTEGGVQYDNPYAFLKEHYSIRNNNLVASMNASYKIFSGLSAKILLGYNQQHTNEQVLSPAEAKRPSSSDVGPTTQVGRNQFNSWNIEPQIEYTNKLWKGKLNALLGTTFHTRNNNNLYIEGSGYSSDALMEALNAATIIDGNSSKSVYRYQALFGRINYNILDKYIFNLTGRRDGSSRFGPGKQFANFGAVGAAWIFSTEKWMKEVPILSFGKLRASYGSAGNDQIGDYQFVETWSPHSSTYQGASTLVPNNLFNADYAWERNNKIETALDLGFFKDQLLFSVNYFRNRSGNQLVDYRLPYITGFNKILANLPATVENKGWEYTLSGTVIQTRRFKWDSRLNVTFSKNTLIDFPNIETSTYRDSYKIGQSLNLIYKYRIDSVDPETGLLPVIDVNEDGSINVDDFQIHGNTNPKFYGGWRNSFSLNGFELAVFVDYKKQTGRNLNYWLYSLQYHPGMMRNQPVQVLERWQNPGDIAVYPKFMPTATAYANVSSSNFVYGDQSFIKLRNISVSYTFPKSIIDNIGAKSLSIYAQGQNLHTFSSINSFDPEVQNPFVLPALRTYTFGVTISY